MPGSPGGCCRRGRPSPTTTPWRMQWIAEVILPRRHRTTKRIIGEAWAEERRLLVAIPRHLLQRFAGAGAAPPPSCASLTRRSATLGEHVEIRRPQRLRGGGVSTAKTATTRTPSGARTSGSANTLLSCRLTAAAEHLADELDRALNEQASATQVLEALLGIEVEATRARRQRGRLRFARFPVHKTLADFDFDFQPGLDRKLIAELSTLRFVEERRNVILLGPPGVGKSHLAIALGIVVTEAGYRRLLHLGRRHGEPALQTAHLAGTALQDAHLPQAVGPGHRRTRLPAARPVVGQLDLPGRQPPLREVLAIVLTSNRGFSDWGQVFADPVVATAIVDRLIHNAIVINIRGAAFRPRLCRPTETQRRRCYGRVTLTNLCTSAAQLCALSVLGRWRRWSKYWSNILVLGGLHLACSGFVLELGWCFPRLFPESSVGFDSLPRHSCDRAGDETHGLGIIGMHCQRSFQRSLAVRPYPRWACLTPASVDPHASRPG